MGKEPTVSTYYDVIDYEQKLVNNRILFNKFGRITTLASTDGSVTVGEFTTKQNYTGKTTGEQLTISSTSTADASAGTGATQIYLYAIDSVGSTEGSFPQSYPWQNPTELINLNGTSAVTTSGTDYVGVERAAVGITGTGNVNAGNIIVSGVDSGDVYAEIPLGESITQQTIHYTPAGWSTYIGDGGVLIYAAKPSGGSSPRVTFQFKYFDSILGTEYETDIYLIDASVDPSLHVNGRLYSGSFRERSFMKINASTNTNGTLIFARYSGYMAKN